MWISIDVSLPLLLINLCPEVLHDSTRLILWRHLNNRPEFAAIGAFSREWGPHSDNNLEVIIATVATQALVVLLVVAALLGERRQARWKLRLLKGRTETQLLLDGIVRLLLLILNLLLHLLLLLYLCRLLLHPLLQHLLYEVRLLLLALHRHGQLLLERRLYHVGWVAAALGGLSMVLHGILLLSEGVA